MRVEGVTYEINWKKFHKGAAIFIPCLDGRRAKVTVKRVTDRLRMKVLIKICIVEGIRGLRVWRL